ncbi:MAG: hypothetical protein JSV30_00205 [Candidatus Omnitrophota bacterium]|nr:MAG: hypothetical protein JSV30_00205 [Candidatus Omnitrophota bacterium]
MNLSDFVSKTLEELITGIKNAKESESTSGADINPGVWGDTKDIVKQGLMKMSGHKTVTIVEFDVAITAVERQGTKGGIGVFVGSVGLGSQGESRKENSSVSRIKFSVPVALP